MEHTTTFKEGESARFAPTRTAPDDFVFLRSWVRSPFVTAAMVPSGKALSRALAEAIDPAVPGAVVELGPGTGPVTAALVERGISPDRLILVEFLPEFCDLLRRRYPTARVIRGDAFDAPDILKAVDCEPLAGVVSCLPLYGKKPEFRSRLLHGLLRLGPKGAPFVQATNFVRSPIPFDPAIIAATRSRRIWFNWFPALVWTYRLVN